MQVGLHQFSPVSLAWLRKAAASGEHSRASLAHGLCESEDWRNSVGEPCLASARKALPKLADGLGIVLPAPRSNDSHPLEAYPTVALSCGLQELGDVRAEPVAPKDVKLWRSMMASHHPRGEGRHPGARLPYWIVSSRHGRLGGLSFCAAGWHQQARDIGWTHRERAAHLGRIVNNGRFLILPGVRVPSLASHALGLALSRLADDWHAAYGVRPVLAYTYVDAGHAGTCYAATGWDRCEEKTIRGRSVWMRPLCAEWREVLRTPAFRELGTAPPLSKIADCDGVRSIHYAGRAVARPAGRYGAAVGGKSGSAGLRDLPATRRAEGGVPVSVE